MSYILLLRWVRPGVKCDTLKYYSAPFVPLDILPLHPAPKHLLVMTLKQVKFEVH